MDVVVRCWKARHHKMSLSIGLLVTTAALHYLRVGKPKKKDQGRVRADVRLLLLGTTRKRV
jgi:hypothetical protein